MEADFLREYGINLVRALEDMTWRRFMVLVRGLSVQSATITALRIGHVAPSKRVTVMQTPAAAQRAFAALFGKSTKPRTERADH